jgi:DNA-binding beta-propeller fold protein YncE
MVCFFAITQSQGCEAVRITITLRAALLSATLLAGISAAKANDGYPDNAGILPLPTGQFITPTFAPGSSFATLDPGLAAPYHFFRPDGAIASALSPDGNTLLVVTSGYNTLNDQNGNLLDSANGDSVDGADEYIFVYDVTVPASPSLKAVLRPPNTFVGLAWTPDSASFYISGGNDDVVYQYKAANIASGWSPAATIQLGHNTYGIGLGQYPQAGGISIANDGSIAAVANATNDSFSLINLKTNTLIAIPGPAGTSGFEYDLRPYNTLGQNGVAGGETVYSLALAGNASSGYTVYATALRDREVSVVNVTLSSDLSSATPAFKTYIKLTGSPNNIILNQTQSTAYVSEDNSDKVAVINTTTNAVHEIDAAMPSMLKLGNTRYTGAATNNLVLNHDTRSPTLYVTNGAQNALAILPLNGAAHPSALVPTGWYPTTVAISKDDSVLWVFNNKSDPGANPGYGTTSTYALGRATPPIPPRPYPTLSYDAAQNAAYASNQYDELREQSGMLMLPTPQPKDYAQLTLQVAQNNGYTAAVDAQDKQVMDFLHKRIQHVIYIVKENRTFDQVLGDLKNGADADPALTVFGKTVTPNFHQIATQFVTLDNFFCTAEVSGNGWPLSTSARETDWNEKNIPMDYAFDVTRYNAPYDAEGQNRNVSVGYGSLAARIAEYPSFATDTASEPGGSVNVLPQTFDDGAPDGPDDEVQKGYLWDAAQRAGLTFRDYGFLSDNSRYGNGNAADNIPENTDPLEPYYTKTQVQFPTNPSLHKPGNFDPYFRGFDNAYPDVSRFAEFQREFQQFDATNTLPNLVLLRYMHDHMGSFGSAILGVNTPEAQQADNDLAVGLTLQLVAHSQHYARNTLFVIVEDDAQDGPDHEDAHRSTAYVVGPYVRTNAVVSTRYSTVNAVRTIEDVLGLGHLNLMDAYQRPMTDVFDITSTGYWDFAPTASVYLKNTQLQLTSLFDDGLVKFAAGPKTATPVHTASWWAEKTRGFDWSKEDRVPAGLYNRILWEGLKGDAPYPAIRSHENLAPSRDGD